MDFLVKKVNSHKQKKVFCITRTANANEENNAIEGTYYSKYDTNKPFPEQVPAY